MSKAPVSAYQIAKNATTDINGNPLVVKDAYGEVIKNFNLKIAIVCKCGFRGELWQMLGADDGDGIFCPTCLKDDQWRYNNLNSPF